MKECGKCPIKKQLEELMEKQYRIDHGLLKGPVSTIMGLSQTIEMAIDSGNYREAKELAGKLYKHGHRLKNGINKILNKTYLQDEQTSKTIDPQ